jgi:preprotein translocase subunit SecD
MMHISRLKALGILLTALLVSMLAVPSFFSEKTVQSWLGATLTLPGIIGIVLTIGIAVDSNVLIYERIREEVRTGRSPITAIDAGFTRALATILDSNITTFIAAAVLFFIGTGPVRGFAVTLGIGIITTVFTAFTLTRLMVAWWVGWVRPQQLAIS